MREIKFQGIYRPTGEKFEAYQIDTLNKFVWGSFDGEKNAYCHYSTEPNGKGDAWLREWTGLKDKNGVEIYEGDLIFDGVDGYGQVIWNQDECQFVVDFGEGIELQTIGDWCEVRGNSYEQPYLLRDSAIDATE